MAFRRRAGSWGEERAICSSGKHGRAEIEVWRREEWRAVYQLGIWSQLTRRFFSSILLKSLKTSEDSTADCQVTLQTVRYWNTKKKKQNRNSSWKSPLRTRRPMVWFVHLYHPLWSRARRPLLLCCYWKPVGGAKLHNAAFKGYRQNLSADELRKVYFYFFCLRSLPSSPDPHSQRSSFWRETNERNQGFSLCEWQQWQLQFNSTTWSPFRLKQKVSFSI